MSPICIQFRDKRFIMIDRSSGSTSLSVLQRIQGGPNSKVWTPQDFVDLGYYDSIKKSLQRLVNNHKLRRIDRGLYDQYRINSLTKQPSPPDYRMIIDAISRRDNVRILVDGLTAANDLGLTNAVPAKVVVHTDARLQSIQLDKLIIQFKLTAPSKLYWVGHPAMRIVQALYWLRDGIKEGSFIDEDIIRIKILRLLQSPKQGDLILDDLKQGLTAMPSWMQNWINNLLNQATSNINRS